MLSAALALAMLIVVAGAAPPIYAQGGTTRYVYDDNGRLHAVIAPNGEANVYEYDGAGNITAIRRNTASTLELLDFFPREGAPGTQVTIIGTGFGAGVNAVGFNGTPAQIVSANAPQIVVTVPPNATTGPISVTTPSGTASTASPFTVRGIAVTPSPVTLLQGDSIQLMATVFITGNQSVVWNVDGVEGGSAGLGAVTTTGLYTAPPLPLTQPVAVFRVRAVSVTDPVVFGESVITVKNPEFIYTPLAALVSVFNGNLTNVAPVAASVSVLNGNLTNVTPIGASVSVLNGNLTNVTPIGTSVSVLNGNLTVVAPMSAAVSTVNGPHITNLSPGSISVGTSTTLTITGVNLGNVTMMRFFNSNGTNDTGISASNLNVTMNGTVLTATVAVSAGTAIGQRIVVVSTATNNSLTSAISSNVLNIVP